MSFQIGFHNLFGRQLVAETSSGKDTKIKIFRKGQFLTKTVTITLRSSEELASLDEKPNPYGYAMSKQTAIKENRNGVDSVITNNC